MTQKVLTLSAVGLITEITDASQPQLNGTGFVKASGTTISYDSSTYLTTASASSTYMPLTGGSFTGAVGIGTSTLYGSLTTYTNNSGAVSNGVALNNAGGGAGTGDSVTLRAGGTVITAIDWQINAIFESTFYGYADIVLKNGASPTERLRIDSAGGAKFAGAVGFNGTSPIAKPTITGSRAGNAALASLLTALASYGLITDSTTA